MARPLKVYAADIDGLYEWIVAAPNQGAALQAFGVHQNLFAQGKARPTDEPDALAAARAAPGTPLRRRLGGKAAFAPASSDDDVSSWEAAAKAVGARKTPRAKPDRRALEAAEAELGAFESRAGAAQADLRRRREALDVEGEELETRLEQERADLEAALKAAKTAYSRRR
jgi:hypothetical protein